MKKDDLREQQKVVVLVWRHDARVWDRFEGTVVHIARKFVTIEYVTWSGGQPQHVKFLIEEQQVPSQFSYATQFRTLEQDALEVRKEAAREGLRELGLTFTTGTIAGETLTLDEQEAIVACIRLIRQGYIINMEPSGLPGKEG